MELAITKYLREHGLEKTLEDFKLKHKEYPHKILLKYDSIESNFTNEEVRDARGLVLQKDTWRVMSIAFRKFFNLGEGHAAPVNWETSRIFKKMDGTLIHVYHDFVTGDICFGTTGTAEGEGDVDNFHYTKLGGTFSDLFMYAVGETIARNSSISIGEGLDTDERKEVLNGIVKAWFVKYAGMTLAFELCTPYNIVVTPHTDSNVFLLGARKLDTLEEVSFDELEKISKAICIPMAPTIALNSTPDALKESFEGMPYREEGYVVCDYGNPGDYGFPRLKMKNPAYCAIHFFKDSTAFWRIIDIVRGGEDNVNEYKATFPGRSEEIEHLLLGWNKTIEDINVLAKEIAAFEEYKDYRTHRAKMLVADKQIEQKYKDKFAEKGIVLAEVAARLSVEALMSMHGINEKNAKELKNILMSDRGDVMAEKLRKVIAGKIILWSQEPHLRTHRGFFFEFLNSEQSSKKYLMDFDGKELYGQLIKGYETSITK